MLLYFALQVDPSDGTYMPSVIVLSGGDSLSSMKEIVTVNIASTDRIVSLLSNMKEFFEAIRMGLENFSLHVKSTIQQFKRVKNSVKAA